ncbi:MAG TPA: glycosyltransferase [Crocinitomicaceae bacterium]|nr:glycosyltransferase [Crocinitomicaceae bacterium]
MSSFLIFFTVFTVVILVGQLTLKVKTVRENHLLENLTVVIPFRNEENNLLTLINSLSKQSKQPKQFIFINDHSTDSSVSILETKADFEYTLLHLTENQGKKAALEKAIKQAETNYILTLDADVQLDEDYFFALYQIELQDVHILPVKISNAPFSGFFNLDYYYLFALSNGLHFFKRPIVASGANFLFKKEHFTAFLAQSDTQKISSGDDQYFLNYLIENNVSVAQTTDKNVCVSTTIPTGFSELLYQRIRWIKKSASTQNILPVLLGFIGFIYHIGSVLLFFFHQERIVELVLIKVAFDSLVFYPYLVKIGERISLFKLLFFSMIYPFWIIFIGISAVFIQPKWKGRKVVNK